MASTRFMIVLFLNFEQIPGFGWSDWTTDARATTAPTQTNIECSKFCSSNREYIFGFSAVSILYAQGINTAVCAISSPTDYASLQVDRLCQVGRRTIGSSIQAQIQFLRASALWVLHDLLLKCFLQLATTRLLHGRLLGQILISFFKQCIEESVICRIVSTSKRSNLFGRLKVVLCVLDWID